MILATLVVLGCSFAAFYCGLVVNVARIVDSMRKQGWREPLKPGTPVVEIELTPETARALVERVVNYKPENDETGSEK